MIANVTLTATHLRRAFPDSDLTFAVRGQTFYAYTTDPLVNPNTPEQQLSRLAWKESCAAWRKLSPELKHEWQLFARANYRRFERETIEALTGFRLFQACAQYRMIMGLPVVTAVPRFAPPEKVVDLELLPSADPSTYRFRVHHNLGRGVRLIVSMTPATVAVSRAPEKKNKRHIKGWGAASTCELPKSGETIEFTQARYATKPGQRFGVWVRVVREADGLARDEKMFDFIRPELPAEPMEVATQPTAPKTEAVNQPGDGKAEAATPNSGLSHTVQADGVAPSLRSRVWTIRPPGTATDSGAYPKQHGGVFCSERFFYQAGPSARGKPRGSAAAP